MKYIEGVTKVLKPLKRLNLWDIYFGGPRQTPPELVKLARLRESPNLKYNLGTKISFNN